MYTRFLLCYRMYFNGEFWYWIDKTNDSKIKWSRYTGIYYTKEIIVKFPQQTWINCRRKFRIHSISKISLHIYETIHVSKYFTKIYVNLWRTTDTWYYRRNEINFKLKNCLLLSHWSQHFFSVASLFFLEEYKETVLLDVLWVCKLYFTSHNFSSESYNALTLSRTTSLELEHFHNNFYNNVIQHCFGRLHSAIIQITLL